MTQPDILKSKKAKVAGAMDMGLLGLIMADKLDPEVGAICVAAVTVAYLVMQGLVDVIKKWMEKT